MQKRNILLIEPFAPWPLRSGGHQAIFNGIDAIKDDYNVYLTYEVFLNEGESDETTTQLQKVLPEVKLCPFIRRIKKPSFYSRCKNKIIRILEDKEASDDDFGNRMMSHFAPNSPSFFKFIDSLVTGNNIDIVQVEMVWRITLGLALPEQVKKVFVHHELRYVCHELEMSRIQATEYDKACYEIAKTLEVGLVNKYDAIITLSEIDKKKLIESGVDKPIYSSIAVVNTKPTETLHSKEEYVLTYVGPEEHSPNYKGVMWFLENCWNDLLAIDSNYHFRVIGKWNESTILRLTKLYRNVEFLGFVPDINEAIMDTISIVPLTVGSGIRMKILEASTLGVPFVTTTVGVEGLPFVSGEDCFIADSPKDFIESILALKDKELRMKFIANAQQKVIANYSISNLRNKLLSVYNSL